MHTINVTPLELFIKFPFFMKNINENGEFIVNEISEKAAHAMLKELLRWTKGLKLIKEDKG